MMLCVTLFARRWATVAWQEEEKAAYRKRFDEARKAVAARRALRFGGAATGGSVGNKYQQFSGSGHSLD
jgi:hypothetical protein